MVRTRRNVYYIFIRERRLIGRVREKRKEAIIERLVVYELENYIPERGLLTRCSDELCPSLGDDFGGAIPTFWFFATTAKSLKAGARATKACVGSFETFSNW